MSAHHDGHHVGETCCFTSVSVSEHSILHGSYGPGKTGNTGI